MYDHEKVPNVPHRNRVIPKTVKKETGNIRRCARSTNELKPHKKIKLKYKINPLGRVKFFQVYSCRFVSRERTGG